MSLFVIRPFSVISDIRDTKALTLSHQVRKRGQKDIWLSRDGRRLQYHIESSASKLAIFPANNDIEIVENMQNVRSWMQDKFTEENDTQMQYIHYLNAEEGIYLYRAQQFIARNLFTAYFKQSGSHLVLSLPNALIFESKAKQASYCLTDKKPRLVAETCSAYVKDQL